MAPINGMRPIRSHQPERSISCRRRTCMAQLGMKKGSPKSRPTTCVCSIALRMFPAAATMRAQTGSPRRAGAAPDVQRNQLRPVTDQPGSA
jgi:hypothetical protein